MALKRLQSQPPHSHAQPSIRLGSPLFINIKGDVYEVKEEYGRGSYGVVSRVTRGFNEFACKSIFKMDNEENEQFIDRNLNEILIQLEFNHNNISRIYNHTTDEEAGTCYVLQELCKKETFWHMINMRNGITEIEARFFSKQILKGLKEIHGKDIIHHDLKPNNILLSKGTLNPKITDFGLSERLNHGQLAFYRRGGTLPYMAPEVLDDPENNGHSLAADIWSFGIMLVYMITKKYPYQGKDYIDLYNDIKTSPKIDFSGVDISDSLKTLIESILKFNPAERPAAHELLEFEWILEPVPFNLPDSVIYSKPKFDENNQVIEESSKELQNIEGATNHLPIEPPGSNSNGSPYPEDFPFLIFCFNPISKKQEDSLTNGTSTPDIRNSYSSIDLPSPIIYTASIGIDKGDNLYDHHEE